MILSHDIYLQINFFDVQNKIFIKGFPKKINDLPAHGIIKKKDDHATYTYLVNWKILF
jgi:hypothetical protein